MAGEHITAVMTRVGEFRAEGGVESLVVKSAATNPERQDSRRAGTACPSGRRRAETPVRSARPDRKPAFFHDAALRFAISLPLPGLPAFCRGLR